MLADPEDGSFIKKDLPFAVKMRKIEEQNELVKERQELNKSLPSIYLAQSRKIGKISQQILNSLQKSETVKEIKPAITDLKPKDHNNMSTEWPEAYWNYSHSVKLPKRNDTNYYQSKKIDFWQKKYESEDLRDGESLKKLLQEIKAIDDKAMQSERVILTSELEMNKLPLLPRVITKVNKNIFSKQNSISTLRNSHNLSKPNLQNDHSKQVTFEKKESISNSQHNDSLQSSVKLQDEVISPKKTVENPSIIEENPMKQTSDVNFQTEEEIMKNY